MKRTIALILLIAACSFLPEVVSACEDCVRQAALEESQRNVDRSIDYMGIAVMLIGVLVALLTVIVIIAIALGIFETRKWKALTNKVKKDVKVIEDMKERAVKSVEEARAKVKEGKTPLSKEPTEEVRQHVDDLNRRLDLLEILGVSFKAEDYYNRGVDLSYKNDNETALQAFEKAIELKPDYADAWFGKGFVLSDLDRNKEALESFEKTIKLSPGYITAWVNKGAMLIRMDLYQEGLDACEKAIELKADYAIAWYNKACACSLLEDYPNAKESLAKAIHLDEKYKEKAKIEKDFKALWEDAKFIELTS